MDDFWSYAIGGLAVVVLIAAIFNPLPHDKDEQKSHHDDP